MRLGLAVSLLLGFLPRVVDHHWAERQPGHGHLVDDSGRLHRHPYETAHGHERAGWPGGDTPTPGRVFVTFHDNGAASALAPALPLLSEGPTPAAPPFGRFSPAPGEESRPAGTAPGVPHRPPISLV